MWRAIVFDGDDTLWQTEPLYDDARQRAREVVEAAGLDGAAWEALERRHDVENVARLGYSPARFPSSCVAAYETLVAEAGLEGDADVVARVDAAAKTAFAERAQLVPHARESLAALRARGIRLVLLTKGDPELQRRRIDQSGLASFFDVIEIVEEKTPEAITSVLCLIGVPAGDALSVGNSLPSDVLPSLAAGVQPVWIDAHVWEHEQRHVAFEGSVIQVESLSKLLEVAR